MLYPRGIKLVVRTHQFEPRGTKSVVPRTHGGPYSKGKTAENCETYDYQHENRIRVQPPDLRRLVSSAGSVREIVGSNPCRTNTQGL